MTHVIEEQACFNCGRTLSGPYCAGCGQKRTPVDLTLGEFLHETTQELTHWDGKIPATLKALFFAPGLLTLDFLAGRRARWLLPLRLYLICSIAYFVSGPTIEAITHRSSRELARVTFTDSEGRVGLTPEYRREVEQGWPARVFGMERLERAAANSRQLNREINSILPKAMFLLLPVFAALTRIMWRRKQPHYPAHLYLALHVHAAWFGAMTLLTIFVGFVPSATAGALGGLAVFLYVVWYGLMTVRRVFNDSWLLTLGKAAAVACVYAAFTAVLSLGLLGIALLRM